MGDKCRTCDKASPEVSLKRCGRCRTAAYCSPECQKADWKTHRETCSGPREVPTPSNQGDGQSVGKGLAQPLNKPFTRLDNGTWLHSRPERDVYRLLIDAYRLHTEDTWVIDRKRVEGSLYTKSSDGLEGFRRYLDKVETVRGGKLLPAWWNAEKRKACEELGMDASQRCDLRKKVSKADIIDQYGDSNMPMQMRLFTESVTGKSPGGQSGAPMLKMMAMTEGSGSGGGLEFQTVNIASDRRYN